jgi:hypothetical protein
MGCVLGRFSCALACARLRLCLWMCGWHHRMPGIGRYRS